MKIIKETSYGFTIERLLSDDVLSYTKNKIIVPVQVIIDEEIKYNDISLGVISDNYDMESIKGKTIYYCNSSNDQIVKKMNTVNIVHYYSTQRLWFDSYFNEVSRMVDDSSIISHLLKGLTFLVFDNNAEYAKWKVRN